MPINMENKFVQGILNWIQHYNYKKYWKMRQEVINPKSKTPKLLKVYYLLRIKRMDAKNNASMGTNLGRGAAFATPPNLPHGLNGIFIHPSAKIGKNCTIYHQVTIGGNNNGKRGVAIIGDNCLISTGVKIIGNINIGSNVIIGANAVVVKDVPDNCIVGGVPAKIIKHNSDDVLHLKQIPQ